MYEILKGCPLFKGLNPYQIEEYLEQITFSIKKYVRGEVIAHGGDTVVLQYIILEGSIKGEMVDFAGKVIKIEDIEAPRPLAPAFLFGRSNRYPVNIIANSDVKLLSIPREEVIRLMQKSDVILKNFVDNVSDRAQFLTSKIKFLSFTTLKGKLSQYLLDLSEKTGSDELVMPHSQSQLAELFGVARPSVGRAVGEMNRSGIIKTNGRQVSITDKRRMAGLLR